MLKNIRLITHQTNLQSLKVIVCIAKIKIDLSNTKPQPLNINKYRAESVNIKHESENSKPNDEYKTTECE